MKKIKPIFLTILFSCIFQNLTKAYNLTTTFTLAPSSSLCVGQTVGIKVSTDQTDNTNPISTINLNYINISTSAVTSFTVSVIPNIIIKSGTNILLNIIIPNFSPTSTYSLSSSFLSTNQPNGTFATGTLTIVPTPSFSITALPTVNAVSSQTVCPNSTVSIPFIGTGISYNWVANNTTIGNALSGTGTNLIFTASNSTASSVTSNFTVTPVSNGCVGTSTTFSITVKPAVTATVSASPLSQTVCPNSTTTLVAFTGSGTSYNWAASTNTIGIASSGTGTNVPSFNAINPTGSSVVSVFTVTPISNGCNGATTTFSITVQPTATVTASPLSQTVCPNSTTTLVAFTGSGTSYNWAASNTTIGIASSGTGTNVPSFNAINPTGSSVVSVFTVTPISNGCNGATSTFSITVQPTATVSASPLSQTVCPNSTTTLVAFTGSGTSYNWAASNTTIGIASSGTGTNVPSFTAINPSGLAVTSIFTVTPILNGCNGATSIFSITVQPTATVTPIASQVFCPLSTTTLIPISGSSGTTFNWVASTSTIIGIASSGYGDIPSFQVIDNLTGTSITSVFTVTPVSNSCNGATATFSITINPKPIITSSNFTICSGTNIKDSIKVNSGSNNSLIWTNSNSLSIHGQTNYTNATIPSTLNDSLINELSIVLNSIIYTINAVDPNGLKCISDPKTIAISVNPKPYIKLATDNFLICDGSKINVSYDNTFKVVDKLKIDTSKIISYAQPYNFNTGTILFQPSSTYALDFGGIANSSTNDAQRTYIYKPITVSNGLTCNGTEDSLTVKVYPTPTPTISANIDNICSGEMTSIYLNSNYLNSNLVIYNWTVNHSSNILPLSLNGSGYNYPNLNLTNTQNTSSEKLIYTISSIILGCTTFHTTSYTQTVKPKPLLSSSVSTIYTICSGDTTKIQLKSTLLDNSKDSFKVTSRNPSPKANIPDGLAIPTNYSPITTLIEDNIFNSSNVALANVNYDVLIKSDGCESVIIPLTVNVNPLPKINSLSNYTICSGDGINVPLGATTNGLNTINWQVTNMPLNLDSNATIVSGIGTGNPNLVQNIIDKTNRKDSTYTNSIHITSDQGCVSDTSFNVTVHPLPIFDVATTSNICSGNFTNINLKTSTDNNSTFKWSILKPDSIKNYNSSNSIYLPFHQDSLYSKDFKDSNTITYIISAKSNFGCISIMDTAINQVVNPTPKFIVSDTTLCAQESFTFIPTVSTPSGNSNTSFVWQLINSNYYLNKGYKTLDFNGNSKDGQIKYTYFKDSLLNNSNEKITLTYIYTITSDKGCKNAQNDGVPKDTVNIVIKPTPNLFTISPLSDLNYCANTEFQMYQVNRTNSSIGNLMWYLKNKSAGNKIYLSPTDSTIGLALVKIKFTDTIIVKSYFENTTCYDSSTLIVNKTSSSSVDPLVMLKIDHVKNDTLLICLANNIDEVFGYNWGRINTKTLKEDLFPKEKGQEYYFNKLDSTGNFDTLNYFYWVEVKYNNESCVRRAYLSNHLLNAKMINYLPTSENSFSLNVYPNPTNNILKIELNGVEKLDGYEYEIFDYTGKLVQKESINNKISQTSVIGLNDGLYLVVCKQNGIIVSTKKFIKQ